MQRTSLSRNFWIMRENKVSWIEVLIVVVLTTYCEMYSMRVNAWWQAARKRITWQVNTFLHLLALALDRHSTHWSRKLKLTHQRSILWQQLIGHFLSLYGTLQKFTPSPTRTYFPLLWLFVSGCTCACAACGRRECRAYSLIFLDEKYLGIVYRSLIIVSCLFGLS